MSGEVQLCPRAQIPRFTTMLRSFAADPGTAQDIAAQHLKRTQLLQQRLARRKSAQACRDLDPEASQPVDGRIHDIAAWPPLRVNRCERQPSFMFNLALRRVIVKYQARFLHCRALVSVYAIQVSKLGATELAVSILGPWDKAPKPGRVAYEQYTAAIAALVGGEASTEVRVI